MGQLVRNLILIFPVIFAGVIHSFVIKKNYLSGLAVPLDKMFGHEIFGKNKTFRGFIVMSLGSVLGGIILYPLNYYGILDMNSTVLLSFGMGLSYSLAELPNSFLKRRLKIPSGSRPVEFNFLFYFFDQFDSVFGVVVFLYLCSVIKTAELFAIFLLGGFIHIIFDVVLHKTKVKKTTSSSLSFPKFR